MAQRPLLRITRNLDSLKTPPRLPCSKEEERRSLWLSMSKLRIEFWRSREFSWKMSQIDSSLKIPIPIFLTVQGTSPVTQEKPRIFWQCSKTVTIVYGKPSWRIKGPRVTLLLSWNSQILRSQNLREDPKLQAKTKNLKTATSYWSTGRKYFSIKVPYPQFWMWTACSDLSPTRIKSAIQVLTSLALGLRFNFKFLIRKN